MARNIWAGLKIRRKYEKISITFGSFDDDVCYACCLLQQEQ